MVNTSPQTYSHTASQSATDIALSPPQPSALQLATIKYRTVRGSSHLKTEQLTGVEGRKGHGGRRMV